MSLIDIQTGEMKPEYDHITQAMNELGGASKLNDLIGAMKPSSKSIGDLLPAACVTTCDNGEIVINNSGVPITIPSAVAGSSNTDHTDISNIKLSSYVNEQLAIEERMLAFEDASPMIIYGYVIKATIAVDLSNWYIEDEVQGDIFVHRGRLTSKISGLSVYHIEATDIAMIGVAIAQTETGGEPTPIKNIGTFHDENITKFYESYGVTPNVYVVSAVQANG